MKKIIILIIIVILTDHNYAEVVRGPAGYLGYSYSQEETDGGKIKNHSIGQEFLFISQFDFFDSNIPWFWGLNYKFGDNGKSLTSHFIFNPGLAVELDSGGKSGSCFSHYFIPAIGTNVSYNLEKKIWGIGPQVDLVNMITMLLKLNITYRYNIYFKSENRHEIGFTISIIDYAENI